MAALTEREAAQLAHANAENVAMNDNSDELEQVRGVLCWLAVIACAL